MHEQGIFNLLTAMFRRAQRDARSRDALTRQSALDWLYGHGCDLAEMAGVDDEEWYEHVDELTMEKAA